MSDPQEPGRTEDGPSNTAPWWKRRGGVALALFVVLVVITWVIATQEGGDEDRVGSPGTAGLVVDHTPLEIALSSLTPELIYAG